MAPEALEEEPSLLLPPPRDETKRSRRLPRPPDASRTGLSAFATGPSNQRAFRAVREVVQEPGDRWNPLLILGPSGTGKTHLLRCAVAEAKARRAGLRCVYLSSEQFWYRFVQALRHRQMRAFRRDIRHIDLLALDDLDGLGHRTNALGELLHTIDDLVGHNRQIIISSAVHPRDFDKAPAGLVDRLLGQMVVEMQPPSVETRAQILKRWVEDGPVSLGVAVIDLLSRDDRRDLAELQGAYQTLAAHASVNGGLDAAKARAILHDLDRGRRGGKPTLARIAEVVAGWFGVSLGLLSDKSRKAHAVRPRQVAMFLAKEMGRSSLREIGEYFGGRAASTVASALARVEANVQGDKRLTGLLDEIRTSL